MPIPGPFSSPDCGGNEHSKALDGIRGIAILLVIVWVVVKLIVGIAGALIHLLLFIAALVLIYVVVRHVMARRP